VYANAGHIYPLLVSSQTDIKKEPNSLKIRSVPLGISYVWQAQLGELVLTSGSTLLLASDGITEAMVDSESENSYQQNSRRMLNLEGLWELLQSEPKPLILKHLLSKIQADDQVQGDDQTILSLEVL
jgi:serine phosphatase RsbU (regulator of sigma subunit)